MKKHHLLLVLSLLLVSLLLFPSCAPTSEEGVDESKLKAAFIYFGAIGDHGWTYQHELGRQYVEEKLDFVETIGLENVPTGADAERILTDLANDGYDVIFATSFDYQESTLKVAKEFPEVIFLNSTGDKTDKNVSSYFGREYQGFYLNGVMAGLMTKSNILGFIASYEIPPVFQDVNAFLLGARSVNPEVKVKTVWVNTWYDPAAEYEATMGLIDVGADVIAHETDSPAPHQAAEERGVYGVGKNSDMSKFAPEAFLTGTDWKWGNFYEKVLTDIYNGTWSSEAYWGSIAEGIFDMAPYAGFVPEEVIKTVEDHKAELVDGKQIFAGKLVDNKGNIRANEGEEISDEELRRLDWLLEGIE